MRAILISPWNQTIAEVEHNGDFRQIYSLLSSEGRKVETFDTVTIDASNVLFLDGEGFIVKEAIPVFSWRGYAGQLCGNALILGNDEVGEAISATISLEEVCDAVVWTNRISTGRLAGAGPNPYGYTLGTPVTEEKK